MTIKEEKITFETAKLAKAKGFNPFTKGYYVEYLKDKIDPEYPEGGGPFSMKKGEIDFENEYITNNDIGKNDLSCSSYCCYAAPTQSIMQRWLRENHNIDVWAKPFILENMEKEYLGFINFLPNASNGKNYTTHKTYEEAIEFGIQKALESL